MPGTMPRQFTLSYDVGWDLAQRIAFRFAFAYWILYNLPFPMGMVPGTTWIQEKYDRMLQWLIPWFGKNVLHISSNISGAPTGSGDRLYDYVQLLLFIILAITITILWSILDKKRTEYKKLNDWLRVYVRYSLGTIMLGYGSYKVIKLQFPSPSLERLLESYGQSSPMGLLWAFMGYSTSYSFFCRSVRSRWWILAVFPAHNHPGRTHSYRMRFEHCDDELQLRRSGKTVFLKFVIDGHFLDDSGSKKTRQFTGFQSSCTSRQSRISTFYNTKNTDRY
jgi:hypothetical protein